jgi:hypothetical protein
VPPPMNNKWYLSEKTNTKLELKGIDYGIKNKSELLNNT